MKCQPELTVTGNYKAIVKGGTCRFRDSSLTHAFHFCSNNSGVVCLSGHGAVYVYRQKAPVCSMSYQNQFTSPSERCTNLTVYTGCRKARESSIFRSTPLHIPASRLIKKAVRSSISRVLLLSFSNCKEA